MMPEAASKLTGSGTKCLAEPPVSLISLSGSQELSGLLISKFRRGLAVDFISFPLAKDAESTKKKCMSNS